MLNVSHAFVNALTEAAERQRKAKFLKWIASLAGLPVTISADTASQAYDRSLSEAQKAEINTDERLFDYILARILMPDMNGLQYVMALDVVFSKASGSDRLRALINLREQDRG
jgi:CheY-like chemotaxis protein